MYGGYSWLLCGFSLIVWWLGWGVFCGWSGGWCVWMLVRVDVLFWDVYECGYVFCVLLDLGCVVLDEEYVDFFGYDFFGWDRLCG